MQEGNECRRIKSFTFMIVEGKIVVQVQCELKYFYYILPYEHHIMMNLFFSVFFSLSLSLFSLFLVTTSTICFSLRCICSKTKLNINTQGVKCQTVQYLNKGNIIPLTDPCEVQREQQRMMSVSVMSISICPTKENRQG